MDEPVPAYAEVAARQNERVGRITHFWSAADFTMQWRDDEDKLRTETGEGYLMFVPPRRTGLVFKKLSETYLWLGSDEERFWLFAGGEDSVAYVGRHENAFDPKADPLPMTIQPTELADLLGVFPFPDPAATEGEGIRVERPASLILHTATGRKVRTPNVTGWLVRIDGPWGERRVYLDPQTYQPIRVELVGRGTGRVAAWSELAEYKPVYGDTYADGNFPLVPTRMVFHQGEPFRLDQEEALGLLKQGEPVAVIELRGPRDTPSSGDWNPAMFSFEAIEKRMRPRERVVLDARCANPAVKGTSEK